MEKRLSGWSIACIVIAAVGALNWGLIGLFNWNALEALLGGATNEGTRFALRLIYSLVGLVGLISLIAVASLGSSAGRRTRLGRSDVPAHP